MNYFKFLATMPDAIRPHLPAVLQEFQPRQPSRWIVQINYGEPRLHYEIGRTRRMHDDDGRAELRDLELALHFESKDSKLNRYLLLGLRRHLMEIRDTLGEQVEAEMWDRGWTKIYERYPGGEIGPAYQAAVAQRMATFMTHIHPFYVELRRDVSQIYR